MTKLAIGIDLHRCIGCNTCALACKMQNNVPDGMLWNRVLTEGCERFDSAEGTYPNLSRTYLPLACQHCENPACERVCPTGATYKDDKGRVEIDYDKCIGCRMCLAACPYTGVRSFNWEEPAYYADFALGDADAAKHEKHTVEKCIFCTQRVARGEQPACVQACRYDALVFGDTNDPNSYISKMLAVKNSVRVRAVLGTHPNLHYIPKLKEEV